MPIVRVVDIEGYIWLAYFKLINDHYDTMSGLNNAPSDYVAEAMRNNNFGADYYNEYMKLNKIGEEN